MRTWIRLTHRERCGTCRAELSEGTAAQAIELRGVKRKLYRGECCAGDAPPNLPEQPKLALPPMIDPARLDAIAPNRTRGDLKAMTREYFPYKDTE